MIKLYRRIFYLFFPPMGGLDDIRNRLNNYPSDYDALRSDWQAVGDDLRTAIKLYEKQKK